MFLPALWALVNEGNRRCGNGPVENPVYPQFSEMVRWLAQRRKASTRRARLG